ncbi:CDP-alcohol phosphatidyltransferase-domain-containing protein [Immersiella caudata]|uniref:CDP-alcohol phosphatidyltransferase-domain-containing protein n=1 Tax=Immersiella caudata TaxID=314043 RepID=A0AA39WWV5_9PEZI|nr:CDP-alcohol phosphatidyltransferase-domain-containing protein [Immersiella caudata]
MMRLGAVSGLRLAVMQSGFGLSRLPVLRVLARPGSSCLMTRGDGGSRQAREWCNGHFPMRGGGNGRLVDVPRSSWPSSGQDGLRRWFGASGRSLDREGPEKTSPLKKVIPSLTKHENIYTIPNILTASRLVAAPFIGYCILNGHDTWALGLFAYAGITDLLDGWIARRWNQGTVVGTVIDPMADKTLMTILTVTLAIQGSLPVWLAVIILGRDVGLAISAIYYRWISLPPPKTFTRYWDFSLPSAEVRPTTISKYNTALQLGLIGMTTVAPVIPAIDLALPLGVMQYVVAATTIWSGASYIYSKDAVKILPHSTPGQTKPEKDDDKKTP